MRFEWFWRNVIRGCWIASGSFGAAFGDLGGWWIGIPITIVFMILAWGFETAHNDLVDDEIYRIMKQVKGNM